MSTHSLAAGKPDACPACDLPWPYGPGDRFLVGYHYGRTTFECRRCGHVHGLGYAGNTPAPMNSPDHQVNERGARRR